VELDSSTIAEMRRALLEWYRRARRDLPWRRANDPYATWVSEIMLQQTRVDQATPYFHRWMARFPTVEALASAPLDDVLAHWSGLGYYARARNLHAAAREIQAKYGGRFPDEPVAIRALPGIGRYTAGAILSIAFGRAEPILDGNVARVLARRFALDGAPDDRALQKTLWSLAAALVPDGDAADFNQAMMELGALVCTPRAPACLVCPLVRSCAAHARGAEEKFPAPKTKKPPRPVDTVALLLERRGALLLCRRPPRGLWGGLWEPPTGELERGEPPEAGARRVAKSCIGLDLRNIQAVTRFEHVLSHRRMCFHVFRAAPRGRLRLSGYDAAKWSSRENAKELGVAAWTSRLFEKPERKKPRSPA
jgi:A/G-specific adenine glycosylase